MQLTKSEIFWKCWWWSVIFGIIVAVLFWLLTGIGDFSRILNRYISFFDTFIAASIIGCYFGAGYVGWRIAEKHYNDKERRFIRRYVRYSLITFVILVAVAYSPLSILGLFWSFIAPLCVLWSLNYVQQQHQAAKPKRSRH